MKANEVRNIRLQTRVSQKDLDNLGGRDIALKLLKAVIRMRIDNKLELIEFYEKQKANYEI
jgi:hypothetical protein